MPVPWIWERGLVPAQPKNLHIILQTLQPAGPEETCFGELQGFRALVSMPFSRDIHGAMNNFGLKKYPRTL